MLKSNDIEIAGYGKADEAIKELCESCFYRFQIELETSVRGSDFIFDCVKQLHQKCLTKGFETRWNIYSPDLIKNEKTISINNDDKCLQYAATDA